MTFSLIWSICHRKFAEGRMKMSENGDIHLFYLILSPAEARTNDCKFSNYIIYIIFWKYMAIADGDKYSRKISLSPILVFRLSLYSF